MADKQVAAPIEQIDREEIRGARHMGAAVAGHRGSSLSVVLAGGPYRWISKALSTLRHLTHLRRRRIDVARRRVENGEAFSTRHFQATSLRFFLQIICWVYGRGSGMFPLRALSTILLKLFVSRK